MNAKHSPEIFICYRRSDSSLFTGRLYDDLVAHFGRDHVFMDWKNIGAGKFKVQFNEAINSCKVFVPVIGPNWLALFDQKKTEGEDHVLAEIVAAIRRSKQDPPAGTIVPVLQEDARKPGKLELPKELQDLVEFNVHEFSNNWWKECVDKLIANLEEALDGFGIQLPRPPNPELVTNVVAQPKAAQKKRTWRVPSKGSILRSILLGSLLGLLSSVAIGLFYAPELTVSKVLVLRFGLAAVSGLIAGALLSLFISLFINLGLWLLRGRLYLSITGGLLGGAVGGIVIMVIVGALYFWGPVTDLRTTLAGGDLIAPVSVFIGAAISMFGVAIGIIGPKGRVEWRDVVVSILLVMVFVGALVLLDVPLHETIKRIAEDPNLRRTKIIAWGFIEGAFSGAQVLATLLLYERVSDEGE